MRRAPTVAPLRLRDVALRFNLMPTPSTKLMQNLGVMVQLACIWEATARKPGNVHRFADFEDLHYVDFLASAAAIGGVLDKAWFRPVGEIVLEAIKATRQVTTTNTNLGIVLLLTPLAAVVPGRDVKEEIPKILDQLTVADAVLVYEAIRLAEPGGLGEVAEQDVAQTPTVTLLEAMTLAESRDRIAWQYAHNFADIFDIGVPTLRRALAGGANLESAIIETYLEFLACLDDSLIQRKHGNLMAASATVQANALRNDPAALDAWLRERRLNPGTSADLTAASLFVALREGIIPLPYQGRW
jgi:triphosphoribosyl-dephospho-CoA synthase